MRGRALHVSWWWSLPRQRGARPPATQRPRPLSSLYVALCVLNLEHVSSTSTLTGVKRGVSHN